MSYDPCEALFNVYIYFFKVLSTFEGWRGSVNSSDALELKFGEPSRAGNLASRTEPSWTTLKSELNTSWIFFETDKY